MPDMNTPHKPDPLRIKRITESIINLPTLPMIISRMIELVDNPKTSAGSLARLISTDQALTARILKLANSAYYGFPREISTVNMAIVVLGFNTVKDMGLSLSVFDMFKDAETAGAFDTTQFWEHSVGCGIAARAVARSCGHRLAGEAFVAGLLHDIGKVILKQYFPKEFKEIMALSSAEGASLEAIELQVIGTQHGQVGGWLAEKWNLPKIIADSITFHHAPWESKQDNVFVAAISLADYLCHLAGIGKSGRTNLFPLDEQTWAILAGAPRPVTPESIDDLQAQFLLEFDKSETFVSFIHDGMAGKEIE
jgi:putative nucleotidyltransferase with HDIG domain